jgi:RNA polymerase sigma factor (sigma-70 family)
MERDSDHREWVLAALDQFELRLLRYAQRLLGGHGSNAGLASDDARDVVQFVFLRLCDQSPDDIGDRLAQWLYTVCRNRALDVLRRGGGVAAVCEAYRSELRADIDPLSREIDPSESAEQAELHGLLRLLIEALPANQREALDLWADGFSYVEISRIIEKQESHVRVLVHRGLKALREHPQVRELLNDDEAEKTLARSASEGKRG